MMKIQQAKVGQTIKDPTDGHTVKIVNVGDNKVCFIVVKASSDAKHIIESVVGQSYLVGYSYGGDVWEVVNNPREVKKPPTKLETLKKELEQAKANVEKIEASITKVKESLALKPGTMYQCDDHFDGQPAIFMCENAGDHEFYLGGEFRNIEVSQDDLENFKPMTLPNQRKMSKAVVAFIEGRIPTN
jgi:hypothetical protein